MFRQLLVFSLFALAFAAGAPSVQAQYVSPSGPTVTPYLDYFRQDNGFLNPYYNFVRPKFQTYRELSYLDAQVQQQGLRQNQLTNDLDQMRDTPAAATGVGATFMNYSHYYPQQQRGLGVRMNNLRGSYSAAGSAAPRGMFPQMNARTVGR